MDFLELLRSALVAIRTNKTRSFLTTLGVIIGVGSVILLVSIGAGLQSYVTQEFESLGSNLIFIAPGKLNLQGSFGRPSTATPKFTFEDVDNLSRLGDPIRTASGSVFKSVTAEYLSANTDATVFGVDAGYFEIRPAKIAAGRLFTENMVARSQNVAVLGATVAEELFRPGENPLGKIIQVSDRKLEVLGVLQKKGGGFGGGDNENQYIYIPVTTAVKVTGEANPASIVVMATDANGTLTAAKMVRQYLLRKGLSEDDFTVLEPREILETINSFLGAVTGALSGIAAISLVVGGIGIANIMLVSVTERTREIGLRKALGATRRDIMLQFLIEAVVLSVMGGLIGIGIGWGSSALIRQFIETAVTWQSVVLAFGISALVGILSGLAPAIRASRLNPIDALRYE